MNNISNKINVLIADHEIEEAIRLLLKHISPKTKNYQTVIMRSGEFNEIKAEKLNGTISREEFQLKENEIKAAIFHIAKELDEDNEPLIKPPKASIKKLTGSSKSNWKIIVGVLLSISVVVIYIFNNVSNDLANSDKAEYIWHRNPEKNEFWIYRLDPKSNQYSNVTNFTKSFFIGDDVIAYDPSNQTTLLFENYYQQNFNKVPARILDTVSTAFWKKTPESSYPLLYDKGLLVEITYFQPLDNDAIIFSEKNNTTYVLENSKIVNDFKIRPAKILTPQAEAYWKGIWQKNECFLIYRGKEIASEGTGKFEGNDWVIFHPIIGKSFRMKNYPENQDNIFRVAEIN